MVGFLLGVCCDFREIDGRENMVIGVEGAAENNVAVELHPLTDVMVGINSRLVRARIYVIIMTC
jgi:hypothetical protein